MKALLCKQWGPPESLVVEEVPTPDIADDEVLIDVHAAAVNFPDSLIIEKKYQLQPELPFSPGGECAGVLAQVGAKVEGFKAGDRVIASTGYGSFAEQVVVNGQRIMPMPDGLDFETASAFVMTYGTTYHALADRGALAAGETLLVLGAAGGVGLAAVEIGKAMGAKVIAAASSDEKLAVCKEHGADALINYTSGDLREGIREHTDNKGVDVVYDPVGGPMTEAALRSCAWRGRLLVIGFASGEIPKPPLNLALLKGASIVGVFWGSFVARGPKNNASDLKTLFGMLQKGQLKPHIAGTYSLADAPQAITALAERRVSGKLVITPRA